MLETGGSSSVLAASKTKTALLQKKEPAVIGDVSNAAPGNRKRHRKGTLDVSRPRDKLAKKYSKGVRWGTQIASMRLSFREPKMHCLIQSVLPFMGRLFSLALLALALGPADCLANWSWATLPSNLSQIGNDSRIPRISGNGSGVAAAIWSRSNGTNWIVQASFFNNNAWQLKPSDLSPTGKDGSLPQIAIDSNGNAKAVWLEAGTANIIKTADFDKSTGLWKTPLTISDPSQGANYPQVVFDQSGNALAVFTQYNGSFWVVQTRTFKNGVWLPPKTISSTTLNAYDPQVAMASNGTYSVVWMSNDGGLSSTIQAVQFRNGLFGTITQLSGASANAKLPKIAIDEALQTTAIWMEAAGQIYQIASRQMTGGTWSDINYLSPSTLNANAPQIAPNGTNSAVAIWMQQNTDGIWVIRTRPLSSGTWGSLTDLTATQNAYFPKIAANSNGAATATWYLQTSTTTTIQGSYYQGGVWTTRQTLSNTNQNASIPDVAMPTGTQAQAVWLQSNGSNQIVAAIEGDDAPNQYTLTVSRSGSGLVTSNPSAISCGSSCTARFTQGTSVSLSASVDVGQNFIGWSGACQGSGTCSVTMNSNLSVNAQFVSSSDYQIKTIRPPHGQITSAPEGIVCGLGTFDCLKKFGKDAAIVLTATPQEGYDFVRWTGCQTPQGTSCSLVLNQPTTTIKALFRAKPKYPLKVTKTRYGSISSTPKGLQCGNNTRSCSHAFVTGTEVILTATPQEGRTFSGWGGACTGSDNTCQIKVVNLTKVSATFK